ncbi:unnamed protein product [Adineta steineri]|uniref:Uncharacterized protein n=1 Tax=Adineta steineri TaxID=433720 RepID=A0A814L4C4_9BILA|nr:unnamed protein product [Adineta steineri]CAF3544275.1 unnamed protein product [Adineta steineri]
MQYQRLTDDSSLIITESGESHLLTSSLDTNNNFSRIRKYLLILLVIQLIVCVVLLIIDIRLVITGKDDNYRQAMRALGPIVFSFIYYGCGLTFIYRYNHVGIYTFTWLGFLQYISLCGEIFLNIFNIKHPLHSTQSRIGFQISMTMTILSILQAVFMVITLKLAFKILHLIKIFKRDVLEQL